MVACGTVGEIGGKITPTRDATCVKQTLNERDDERHCDIVPLVESEKGGKKSLLMRKSRRGVRMLAWAQE